MDLAPALPIDLLKRAPAAPVASAGAPDSVRKTAEDFEASFLAIMMQPMFAGLSTEAPFGGGQAEAAFKSFLVEAMAKQTAKAGGVGLADAVTRELLKAQETV